MIDESSWNGEERRVKMLDYAKSQLKYYLPSMNMEGFFQTLETKNKECCIPRLTDEEVRRILRESLKKTSLRPDDYTDIGQAVILEEVSGNNLRYSKQVGFLVYDGKVWRIDDLAAQKLTQELTEKQLKEARADLASARKKLDALTEAGAAETEIREAKAKVHDAEQFRKFILKMRTSNRIAATMKEVQPKVQIDVGSLDADGYLLNTPDGTVDLRTGQMMPHRADDYCTKITAVSPDDRNMELFQRFLDQLTCDDKDMQRYLQERAGADCIGVVKREELTLSVGSGGNGKSTFYGLLQKVMGSYSSTISPDVLMSGRNQGQQKRFELADLRGQRLVLAPELDTGQTLDTGAMKRACSIERIRAEKKHRDGFDFVPTHHIVMFTNNMPMVDANDSGTWDRLVVIPFNARFRNTENEVKDYASYLFQECGGAVLTWMIEGARRVIANDFKIITPVCVSDAIDSYKSDNDWLSDFIGERCYIGQDLMAPAGEMYRQYTDFCYCTGAKKRSQPEFRTALLNAGFRQTAPKNRKTWHGLKLKF